MVIDTKDVSSWVRLHLSIAVPVACGLLSWYAATRWQAAIDHNQTALETFYFSMTAVNGVSSTILYIRHLVKLGFFGD
jgi:hypothetical protein